MDRAFQVGDRVWGLYRNGRWYPATIAEARGDGRFVLSWDDGDSEDRVKAAAEVGRVVSAVCGWAGLWGRHRVHVGRIACSQAHTN